MTGAPSAVYEVRPICSLTQPKPHVIAFAGCIALFGGAAQVVSYSARSFRIPKPTQATWYYVSIEDHHQGGDDGTVALRASCQASDTLVGLPGRTYIGAIFALPKGDGFRVLPGGWPAPATIQVGP
jgi:hypothetical protein